MAMTKCAECGHDLSTLADRCPHCGAPNLALAPAPASAPMATPAVRPAFLIAGFLFLAVLVVLAVVATVDRPRSSQLAAGGGSAPPAAAIAVTTVELEAAYEQNTVAADNRFKGQRLSVSGTVQSIDTDFANDVYLVMAGPSLISHTQAHLIESERQTAGGLRPGSFVTVECTGNGDIMKAPMLKDCTFARRSAAASRREMSTMADSEVEAMTEEEFVATFRCPESYATEDETKDGLAQSLRWYGTHHQHVTIEGFTAFRVQQLQRHQCSQTLANLSRANAAETQ